MTRSKSVGDIPTIMPLQGVLTLKMEVEAGNKSLYRWQYGYTALDVEQATGFGAQSPPDPALCAGSGFIVEGTSSVVDLRVPFARSHALMHVLHIEPQGFSFTCHCPKHVCPLSREWQCTACRITGMSGIYLALSGTQMEYESYLGSHGQDPIPAMDCTPAELQFLEVWYMRFFKPDKLTINYRRMVELSTMVNCYARKLRMCGHSLGAQVNTPGATHGCVAQPSDRQITLRNPDQTQAARWRLPPPAARPSALKCTSSSPRACQESQAVSEGRRSRAGEPSAD
jgi:hypothetical protein